MDALKAELRKGSPDLAVIARKMDRTFTFRWKKINDPNTSVEEILLDFPALRERNFVSDTVIFFFGGKACQEVIVKDCDIL